METTELGKDEEDDEAIKKPALCQKRYLPKPTQRVECRSLFSKISLKYKLPIYKTTLVFRTKDTNTH